MVVVEIAQDRRLGKLLSSLFFLLLCEANLSPAFEACTKV
jgi:hypothetical protein